MQWSSEWNLDDETNETRDSASKSGLLEEEVLLQPPASYRYMKHFGGHEHLGGTCLIFIPRIGIDDGLNP